MGKTKKEVLNALDSELINIENLYKSKCVNWKGTTKNTQELYSEIIANELLQKIDKYDNILRIKREKTYCRKNHKNRKTNKTNRYEENFAKQITGLEFKGLGLIKDFQVPLKNKRDDRVGKIDLISFNEKTKILYLIELKFGNNKETLLRAILESYTYFKIVDETKLIKDCFSNKIIQKEIRIKPAVLVVPNCNAYKELIEIGNGERSKLKELINKLGVDCFIGNFEFKISNTEMKQLL